MTNSGIHDKSVIVPGHFDQLADQHAECLGVTDTVRPAINFCQNYSELMQVSIKLFIDGLKLNRQRFKDRTKQMVEIQTLAKVGEITNDQAEETSTQILNIERNMNNTFWDMKRKA